MRGPRRSPDPAALVNVAMLAALVVAGVAFAGWVACTIADTIALLAAARLGAAP